MKKNTILVMVIALITMAIISGRESYEDELWLWGSKEKCKCAPPSGGADNFKYF